MPDHQIPRRDFLRLLSLVFPAAAIDWNSFPSGGPPDNN